MVVSKSYSFCGQDFKEATLDSFSLLCSVHKETNSQKTKDSFLLTMLVYRLHVPLLWTDGEALCGGRENSSAFGRQELEKERQGGAQDTVYFLGNAHSDPFTEEALPPKSAIILWIY